MKNMYNTLACCGTTRHNLNGFASFGADPFESEYDWSKVKFDPPRCEDSMFYDQATGTCPPFFSRMWDNPNVKIKSALGKLFREKTDKYFSTKDNHLWDLIVYHDPSQIMQKLAYLVWDGNQNYNVSPQPEATVDNLRYIKRTLLADWRGDRYWFAYVYPGGVGATVQTATVDNLKKGRAYKLPNGTIMTKTQVMNLLKRNNANAIVPAKLGVQPQMAFYTAADDPNGITGKMFNTPQYAGQDPFCGTGVKCTLAEVNATRKLYNGFSRFGSLSSVRYASDYGDAGYQNEWEAYGYASEEEYLQDQQNYLQDNVDTGNAIRNMYSADQLADSFTSSEFDNRAGYYVDKALGIAFDLAGQAIGNWDGKNVVNQSGHVIKPPTTGISAPVLVGGALILALIMSSKR